MASQTYNDQHTPPPTDIPSSSKTPEQPTVIPSSLKTPEQSQHPPEQQIDTTSGIPDYNDIDLGGLDLGFDDDTDPEKQFGPWLRAPNRRPSLVTRNRWVVMSEQPICSRGSWSPHQGQDTTDGTGADSGTIPKDIQNTTQLPAQHVDLDSGTRTTSSSRVCSDVPMEQEAHCREIMIESWSKTYGQTLMERVGSCGKAIWIWGKHFSRNFQRRLDYWRRRMEVSKFRRDQSGISLFNYAQAEYLRVLRQQNIY
nr:uncharacterized protein LOC109151131 [Ipomoea batatas]